MTTQTLRNLVMTTPLSFARGALCWAAAGLCASALLAGEPVRYQSQPGSTVRIDGTSTIHDWTVETKLIGGYMMLDATFPEKAAEAVKIDPKVEVSIPVRTLKSGKSGMDNVMYRTMKHEQHPTITYKLTEMKLKDSAKEPGQPMSFDTKGELTVAGVKRPVPMTVNIEPMPEEKLKVTGTTTLKMTDFGMDPPAPSIGLGLIKTGDEVKITFEWVTVKKEQKN